MPLVKRRPTRRGALLLLIGGIYFLVGGSYVVLDIEPRTLEPYSFAIGLLGGALTVKAWGVVWACCGLAGMVAGLSRRDRWDRRGFVVLTGFSFLWGSLAFLSLLDGHPRGVIVALIWWAFGGVLAIASGMK